MWEKKVNLELYFDCVSTYIYIGKTVRNFDLRLS